MTLAVERQIDLRWTDKIEGEWVNSLERRMAKRPEQSAPVDRFAKTAALMRKNVPTYDVPGYDAHLGRVPKTDPKDRHVAAAAVGCAPSVLITWNLADFDVAELASLNVELAQPDAFLSNLFANSPDRVHGSIEKAYGFIVQGHQRRNQPVPTWNDYLDVLATRGAPNALPRFAALLRSHRVEETPREEDVDIDDLGVTPSGTTKR